MPQANNHSLSNPLTSYISCVMPISKQLNVSGEKSQNHIVKAYFKVMTTSSKRTRRTVRSFYATLVVNSLFHSSRTLFYTFFLSWLQLPFPLRPHNLNRYSREKATSSQHQCSSLLTSVPTHSSLTPIAVEKVDLPPFEP